jgi:Predicted phosphoesterases, related to the Icc protein
VAYTVTCFSDIHGQISKKTQHWFHENPGDLLLFAGDIQINHEDNGAEFLDFINKLPYIHKVLIFGNHDTNAEVILERARNQYPELIILMNEAIVIDGIKIFGSPYSITFGNWSFMDTDENLAKIWAQIPADTNIVMTHTPPFSCLDLTERDSRHAGSSTLRRRLLELLDQEHAQLKYHVCGHIHEGHGVSRLGSSNLCAINASLLDAHNKLVYSPIVFDYETGAISEFFQETEPACVAA